MYTLAHVYTGARACVAVPVLRIRAVVTRKHPLSAVTTTLAQPHRGRCRKKASFVTTTPAQPHWGCRQETTCPHQNTPQEREEKKSIAGSSEGFHRQSALQAFVIAASATTPAIATAPLQAHQGRHHHDLGLLQVGHARLCVALTTIRI
eukprot:476918-Pelagomonas_calceolata.AAC.5